MATLWFMREALVVRNAEARDAEEFCNVIRTSIIELCDLDHHGKKEQLEEWLDNKTVENCKKWILSEDSNTFVAEKNGKIVGACHIGHSGHLFLCYVLPEVKGLGVGGQLLLAAEKSVIVLGLKSLSLESTVTAKGFYEHRGYVPNGKTKKLSKICQVN
jgi:GNAT superfamily N-acetyltransferase